MDLLTPKVLNAWLLDTFFPRRCVGCGVEGEWLCLLCTEGAANAHGETMLFELPSGLPVVSLLRYEVPVVRELLHYLKYDSITEAAESLIGIFTGSLAAHTLNRLVPNDATLLPVPLSGKRLRRRGYNQAEVLAMCVQPLLRIESAPPYLTRSNQHSQVGQSREQRRTALKNTFVLTSDPGTKTVVLFDDVCTTGATLEAAAEPLLRAGINVLGMTVARA